MVANQQAEILEVVTEIDSPIEDNQEAGLELLNAATIELNEFENSFGLAEYNWPEMSSRRRGRHSYSYYNLNSN